MRKPLGYLDTCLVSGIAKQDLRPVELDALHKLLVLRKGGEISLVTSHVTKEEIERLPATARGLHEGIYGLLDDVPEAQEFRTDSGLTLMGVGGGTREDPLLASIKAVLPDPDDARHVFQAARNAVDYFITDDQRTILRHADAIHERCQLAVVLPSQLVRRLDA
jgi:hypothetical protein